MLTLNAAAVEIINLETTGFANNTPNARLTILRAQPCAQRKAV